VVWKPEQRFAVPAARCGWIPIASIQARRFERTELGELGPLTISLSRDWQDPVVVDDLYHLISGQRRLAAARMMGYRTVPVLATANFYQIVAQMQQEQKHPLNMPMSFTERGGLAWLLSELYEPYYQELKAHAPERRGAPKSEVPSLEKIRAELLGQGRTSALFLRRAYGLTLSQDPRIRELGELALREADTYGELRPAEVRLAQRLRAYRSGAARPDLEKELAKAAPKSPRMESLHVPKPVMNGPDQRKALNQAVNVMTGVAAALEDFTSPDVTLTDEERDKWEKEFTKAIRSLSRVRRVVRREKETSTNDNNQ
jgi:ParB-like nuclease family protein